jgi:hypothetical protein
VKAPKRNRRRTADAAVLAIYTTSGLTGVENTKSTSDMTTLREPPPPASKASTPK